MTFLLGFKMVPSLTWTVGPEAGDVRNRFLRKKLALAKVGARKGAKLGHLWLGARGVPAKLAKTKRATDPTTEAGGEGKGTRLG